VSTLLLYPKAFINITWNNKEAATDDSKINEPAKLLSGPTQNATEHAHVKSIASPPINNH